MNSQLQQSRLTSHSDLYNLSAFSKSMINLSAEIWHKIWHIICRHVDRRSLVAIRLTCLMLSSIATPYLFDNLYLNWLSSSVRRIQKIAARPSLACHVRTLIFEQDTLCQEFAQYYSWARSFNYDLVNEYLQREHMKGERTGKCYNKEHIVRGIAMIISTDVYVGYTKDIYTP